ncbi:plasmid stabilization protein [Streptomyces abyssalis]|uniref:Plasmid stabilization protein n=1 Tax=Streptomyces abyssalis TaxID=933944 RepID=A0A1E7JFZ1_9ACTN|nr:type II toxin-antitoxin system RelE/ParE family toxin [Streptomyces abyssalis]OEU85372.1 plasmid stabilization protein [Streptomyces abyssalis]OEU93165.1 plasmid stabilization protein [Streptomyces abyssalis]OEV27417.1 plasmid stabilization protein [Streptomyces nanshensis]
MSYEVNWRLQALNTATRFLKDDPAGLDQVFEAVDLLAREPRPAGSAELGSQYLRRIHVGRYRVIYEIFDSTVTVVIMHLGRVG